MRLSHRHSVTWARLKSASWTKTKRLLTQTARPARTVSGSSVNRGNHQTGGSTNCEPNPELWVDLTSAGKLWASASRTADLSKFRQLGAGKLWVKRVQHDHKEPTLMEPQYCNIKLCILEQSEDTYNTFSREKVTRLQRQRELKYFIA